MPGEVIISYIKDYRSAPYIFSVKWTDGEITEAQIEVICDELAEKATFAENVEGQEITDVKQWGIAAIKEKAIECRKQLIVKEQEQGKTFAEEIVELAGEKSNAKDRNIQAGQLAQEYEDLRDAQTNQKLLGDD